MEDVICFIVLAPLIRMEKKKKETTYEEKPIHDWFGTLIPRY